MRANLSAAIREVLPVSGTYTVDEIVDALWSHPDFQDMPEPVFKREIAVRLSVFKQKDEIRKVSVKRVPGFNNMNIYQTARA